MAKAVGKITLTASRDVPLNKLTLSQSNVRRTTAGISIEDLAEDIARRGLLQSLSGRPVLEADGAETGMFEIPAGGRRFRALELVVKEKRLSKTALILASCAILRSLFQQKRIRWRRMCIALRCTARPVPDIQDAVRAGCE
jgi:ParB-like chromosome segregation protein Spo0J